MLLLSTGLELFSWKTTTHKDHLDVCLPNSRLLSGLTRMWSCLKITLFSYRFYKFHQQAVIIIFYLFADSWSKLQLESLLVLFTVMTFFKLTFLEKNVLKTEQQLSRQSCHPALNKGVFNIKSCHKFILPLYIFRGVIPLSKFDFVGLKVRSVQCACTLKWCTWKPVIR